MDFDLTKRWCHYFNECTKLPHGSGNEKPLSDFVVQFAKDHGLAYKQDEMWNVIVYKDASAGYESAAPLMIQAHMDMVCEKNKGSDHDFEHDPLDLYVEDGWLRARGTTLGADDCVGVAYMLAILEDDTLAHPPLECVFTVLEEVGLNGAMNLKAEDFKAHRLINLDGGGETSAMTTSAGGCRCEFRKDLVWEQTGDPAYTLSVRGLGGGHSGLDIHLEKGNANQLAARALKEASLHGADIRLVSFEGGLKDNAIPRESDIVFVSSTPADELRRLIAQTAADVKAELEFSDPNLRYELTAASASECATAACSADILNFMFLMPHNFQHRSMAIEGLTLTSLNLGVIRSDREQAILRVSLRSGLESGIDHLIRVLRTLADQTGFSMTTDSRYPAWSYVQNSAIRDLFAKVAKEQYGEEPVFSASHGGTECGIFCRLIPGIDIVSFGPLTENIHTPDEALDLASFDRTYRLLCGLVSACR